MREYTSKVDKLEEAENLRVTEAKETEYKPVVMGKFRSTDLAVYSTPSPTTLHSSLGVTRLWLSPL